MVTALKRSVAAQVRLERAVMEWFENWLDAMQPTKTILNDEEFDIAVLGVDLDDGPLEQAAVDLINLIDDEME